MTTIAFVCMLATTYGLGGRLYGLGIDLLFALRHAMGEAPATPDTAPVVVVAIDEETFRRPPFSGLPQALWTPQLGHVTQSLLDGGARVIGFDIVYPTSVETLLRGYDRELLLALRRGASEGRIVLGRVQHQAHPIEPYMTYAFAAGGPDNIRIINVLADGDGVIRRIPLSFLLDRDGAQERQPSFAAELAGRALGRPLAISADNTFRIADRPIAADADGALAMDFDTRPGAIPTYSLADLFACSQASNGDYFRQHFAGRVVLVGSVLDVEDRKVTSMRLATEPEGRNLPERCAVPVMADLYSGLRRDTVPGVYVQASAIQNLLTGGGLRTMPSLPRAGMILLLSLSGATAAVFAAPRLALFGGALGLLIWSAICVGVFEHGVALPWLEGAIAAMAAMGILFAYRVGIVDRSKRRLAAAFGLYLPPGEIERLNRREVVPTLGGEIREVTVLFADIAGYTEIAEGLPPEKLVADLNAYFSRVTSIVERQGGFVDKFIGDAVLAVFGAPVDNPAHAERAVRAALEMATPEAGGPALTIGERALTVRIGLHTGPVLIGNIGSPRRFNYTVMGDAVNLASRLEGANRRYGTMVLLSQQTRAGVQKSSIALREIDRIRVAGRREPVTIFEPLTPPAAAGLDLPRFAAALADWRAGQLAGACEAWRLLAERGDPVSACMVRIALDSVSGRAGNITDLQEK